MPSSDPAYISAASPERPKQQSGSLQAALSRRLLFSTEALKMWRNPCKSPDATKSCAIVSGVLPGSPLLFSTEVIHFMLGASILAIVALLVNGVILAAVIYLFILLVRALKKYLSSAPVREEKAAICKSLGETLKEHRTRCQMTQEFVAESLGVSRQAVSKWESGKSDPSTSNLLALAKLYGVSAEELLAAVDPQES